jgi:hypothetical protein
MFRSFLQSLRGKSTEQVSLSHADLSAREAWAVVAPRLSAIDNSLLLISVANRSWPLRPGALTLRNGRIADNAAWMFNARTPDGKRQVTFFLSGSGMLAREKSRITVFELDTNGERILPRAVPADWLDSPEAWKIVQGQPSFRPGFLPDLVGTQLTLTQWFRNRRWCWVVYCSFGDPSGWVRVLIVIDAISGAVLEEEITRYGADGMAFSKSAPY